MPDLLNPNAFARRRGFERHHDQRMRRPLPIAFAPRDIGPHPDENLAKLVEAARACDAFGRNLVFDAVRWVIASGKTINSRKEHALSFTVLPVAGEASKSANKRAPLPPAFAAFAKAVIRLAEHREHHAPASYDRILRAFRLLHLVQSERGTSDPSRLRTSDFEEAEVAREYSDNTRYVLAMDLGTIAEVCSEYRLTWARIDYGPHVAPPIVPQAVPGDGTLPTPAAFAALARINAEAKALPDIAMMGPVRILATTHLREGEVLSLGMNCERWLVDGRQVSAADYDAADPGRRRFGLFYYDQKNKHYDTKPILADAVPIVRDAIATARILSAPSREVARHYATAARAWLPASLRDGELYKIPELAEAFWKTPSETNAWLKLNEVPVLEEAIARSDLEEGLARTPAGWSRTRDRHAAATEFMRNNPRDHFTCQQLSDALPVNDLRRWLRKLEVPVRPRSVARAHLERALARLQPTGDDLPQPLEQSLFLYPTNFFASGRQTFVPNAELITTDQLRVWLTGSKYAPSVFYRYHCREENGDPIVVTPHAYRRWLITLVAGGRISLSQLREWTGHASTNAVRGYIRETEAQVAEQVMEVFRLTNMDRTPEAWK